jgi:uncharacterized metal-binding protein YceD (DUF177 family)
VTQARVTPEFSRPIAVRRVGPAGLDLTVEADAAERARLAARLRLPAIAALSCRFRLLPAGKGAVAAECWLTAQVTQTCVLSLDPFDTAVTDHAFLRFVPAGTESDEIDPDSTDEIPFDNDTIDLGEAATEQLALVLDPFPRKPGASLSAT